MTPDLTPHIPHIHIRCGENSKLLALSGEKHYMSGGTPGFYPSLKAGGFPHPVPLDLWDPFGFTKKMSPERKAKARFATARARRPGSARSAARPCALRLNAAPPLLPSGAPRGDQQRPPRDDRPHGPHLRLEGEGAILQFCAIIPQFCAIILTPLISASKGLIVPGIDGLGVTPYTGEVSDGSTPPAKHTHIVSFPPLLTRHLLLLHPPQVMAPFSSTNADLPFVADMLEKVGSYGY